VVELSVFLPVAAPRSIRGGFFQAGHWSWRWHVPPKC